MSEYVPCRNIPPNKTSYINYSAVTIRFMVTIVGLLLQQNMIINSVCTNEVDLCTDGTHNVATKNFTIALKLILKFTLLYARSLTPYKLASLMLSPYTM